MAIRTGLLLAIPLAAAMLAAPAAHAEWRGGWHGGGWHGGGWHGGGWGYRPHYGAGPVIAGTILGLGLGAVAGAALTAPPAYYPPPRVVYAPPPAYYAAPPPAYYAPPAYYPPPAY